MRRPPTRRTSEALKGSVDEPAQGRRRRQGAGRGRVAAAGGCAVEACRARPGDARQGAGGFHRPDEDRVRPAQEHAAGRTGHVENAAAGTGQRLEVQGRADPRRGVAEGRSQRQRQAAQVCGCGSGCRAERDRRPGVDPQIRRHRRQGVHPRRHLGAAGDQPVALAGAAADHRRADDDGAAAGGRRGDDGDSAC